MNIKLRILEILAYSPFFRFILPMRIRLLFVMWRVSAYFQYLTGKNDNNP